VRDGIKLYRNHGRITMVVTPPSCNADIRLMAILAALVTLLKCRFTRAGWEEAVLVIKPTKATITASVTLSNG
jgi:hypothetical protein